MLWSWRHAYYQASHGKQGHQLWNDRVEELRLDMKDCAAFSEVAAQSWPDQDANTAAGQIYKSWQESPGHWREVNSKHSYCGYAMAFNPRKKIWYACGVFAEKRES